MDIARASVKEGGRPFATVIADEKGNIIAEATNQVAQTHDPTAHAEVISRFFFLNIIARSNPLI